MAKNKSALLKLKNETTVLNDLSHPSGPLVDKFVIRLPEGLRNHIKELAEMNHRSMNSEIVMVLEKHVQKNQMIEIVDEDGNTHIENEGSKAEQEVSARLEELKESLLLLMS